MDDLGRFQRTPSRTQPSMDLASNGGDGLCMRHLNARQFRQAVECKEIFRVLISSHCGARLITGNSKGVQEMNIAAVNTNSFY
jgi:hypothetical protein